MRPALSIGPGLIDLAHAGLRCRADPSCREAFFSPSNALVTAAAARRDLHELTHGGYVHVPALLPKWGFALKSGRSARPS